MYNIGDRVKLADIPDPPFPSKIGKVGTVTGWQVGDQPTDTVRLYDVEIDGQKYACWVNEIAPVD